VVHVGKLPSVNQTLIGREDVLQQLDKAWSDQSVGVVSMIAFGGVGKTALSINWWHRSRAPGARRILGWSFYSQGAAEDRQTSADPFLDHALREWFGVSNPPSAAWGRGEMLAGLIRRERTLLILDGLEPIQFPPGPQIGRLKDPGMVALLKELAAQNSGMCICTSRLPLTDLEDYANSGMLPIELSNLTPQQGAEYLRQLKVEGIEEDLCQASHEYWNHALALTLLGTYLVDYCGADVQRRFQIPELMTEDVEQGMHARRVIAAYERMFAGKAEVDVLRALGYFDHPAELNALKLLLPAFEEQRYRIALKRLYDARLITTKDPKQPLDCHPLVREYFSLQATREGHEHLFEHYAAQAPLRPDTIEEMTPLFYAVYHGCQAGRHTECRRDIYRDRILRGEEFYLWRKLGAFGADVALLANFFARPWIEPVDSLPSSDRFWVISQSGFALFAIGRLTEALAPMGVSAEFSVERQDWQNAAIRYGNLSELHLSLGNLTEAITTARLAVDSADRSEDWRDWRQRAGRRTDLADALHQSGELVESARIFSDAERIQADQTPSCPLLPGIWGYRYCDLLIHLGQREEVLRRASQTLQWDEERRVLISIGLDHLSLGRAHISGSNEAAYHLGQAVEQLRTAGTYHHLPRGLLIRATPHDLDEARRMAMRSGMRLYLADYYLAVARLALADGDRTLARTHLAKATVLIQETGYHRRDSDVEILRTELMDVYPTVTETPDETSS
jgi:tetratricopeptide (TPR) repeat protein